MVTPVATPPRIIPWWRVAANAKDAIRSNHGVAINGATYAAGKVGQAFAFDTVDNHVAVPDSPTLKPAFVNGDGELGTAGQYLYAAAGHGPLPNTSILAMVNVPGEAVNLQGEGFGLRLRL